MNKNIILIFKYFPPPTPVYRQYWLVLTLLALPLSLHAFFTPQIKEVDV